MSLLTVYPRFLRRPKNTTAFVDDHLWLHCNASGDPKPKISWSKDVEGGDKLDPNRFIQHPNGTLHIKKVLKSDRGRYYCIAANHAEMKQSKFSLVVQGKENFFFELDFLKLRKVPLLKVAIVRSDKLERFRFENGYNYETTCKLEVFARVLKKKKTPRESFIFLFFFHPKKLVWLFILKEVKPAPDSKMIKLLSFDNLFPPLRHSC